MEELQSPSELYFVTLRGSMGHAWHLWDEKILTAVGDSKNRRLFHNLQLFLSGFLDGSFNARYPGRYWPRENVLQFKPARRTALGCDELLVRNLGKHPVTYLKVHSGDLSLIMDVPRGSEFSVPVVPPPAGEGRYFQAMGELANGVDVAAEGKLFSETQAREHVRYTLAIIEEKLVLEFTTLPSTYLVSDCRQ